MENAGSIARRVAPRACWRHGTTAMFPTVHQQLQHISSHNRTHCSITLVTLTLTGPALMMQVLAAATAEHQFRHQLLLLATHSSPASNLPPVHTLIVITQISITHIITLTLTGLALPLQGPAAAATAQPLPPAPPASFERQQLASQYRLCCVQRACSQSPPLGVQGPKPSKSPWLELE